MGANPPLNLDREHVIVEVGRNLAEAAAQLSHYVGIEWQPVPVSPLAEDEHPTVTRSRSCQRQPRTSGQQHLGVSGGQLVEDSAVRIDRAGRSVAFELAPVEECVYGPLNGSGGRWSGVICAPESLTGRCGGGAADSFGAEVWLGRRIAAALSRGDPRRLRGGALAAGVAASRRSGEPICVIRTFARTVVPWARVWSSGRA